MTRPALVLGRNHLCEFPGCGFRWHGGRWPDHCPDCKAGPHWIASFVIPDEAARHQPLSTRPPQEAS